MRIISLVPSLTELILDLGLENELVGRTKFCIHPRDKIRTLPKIGGTKNVNISAVLDLKPDLIIANKEENSREDIEALIPFTQVYISDISNYDDACHSILKIGELTHRLIEAQNLIKEINLQFSNLSNLSPAKRKVCYLIWNDPLMTIGQDTFIHDMIQKCGMENVFANENRYPIVSVEEINDKQPDYVFLSSEPFPFKEKHLLEFRVFFPNAEIVLIDGEYFSWYGSRMVLAVDYFKSLIAELK